MQKCRATVSSATKNPDIIPKHAGIAQLVEQLLRKQLVGGSSPLSGTINRLMIRSCGSVSASYDSASRSTVTGNIRAQWVVRKQRFPDPWRQRFDVARRVARHTLQHIHPIRGRVDALHLDTSGPCYRAPAAPHQVHPLGPQQTDAAQTPSN